MPVLLNFLTFSLLILQQPYGHPGYVASVEETVTQFSIAAEVGNIGLLAHNYMAGESFFDLKLGDRLLVQFDDRRRQMFIVTDIQEYQALNPLSPYSNFRNLETQSVVNPEELFALVYRGDNRLTLQTCIEMNGDVNWGRLFVIATQVRLMKRIPTQTIE